MKKIILSILCAFMLFSLSVGTLSAYAASKNTVTTSVSKVESKAKGFKVTWKKKSKIKGYQIQYSTSSKFKKSETKTKTITKAKTTSATINKLKGCNKKYYVRIRTYKVVNDKKIYSSWSKTRSVTTLKHKYSSATCTKAKVCKYCEKTSGEKLGHKWSAATCTKAKTCTRCKKTSGEKLGHKWSAATCTKAKTCTRCKKTSGEKLGHSWSDWSTIIAAEIGKPGAENRICSTCKKSETRQTSALKEDPLKELISVELPQTPLYVNTINYNTNTGKYDISHTVRIDSFYYKVNSLGYLDLYCSGEKTYDIKGANSTYFCEMNWRLYDTNGYFIDAGWDTIGSLKVGDKFKDHKINVSLISITPGTSYRLEVFDSSYE